MHPILWVPVLVGVLWLVWVRATERHLIPVRVVGSAVAGLVLIVAVTALVLELVRRIGFLSFPLAVAARAIAMGTIAGLVGILIWRGRVALLLRWVGLFFVSVAPMVFFGTGLLSVAAALFYAPCCRRRPTADGKQ